LKTVASSQLPVASEREKPELTCDLHRPGAVYVGRCIYFETRQDQEHCNNRNGPLFCPTAGRENTKNNVPNENRKQKTENRLLNDPTL
jgi:hypothetical protein